MNALTDAQLRNWQEEEVDLHEHFEGVGLWHWADIAEEARRVGGVILDFDLEKDSILDELMTACAAQAVYSAFNAVGAAIGVDGFALMLAVSPWYENQNNLPAPVSAADLVALCKEQGQ